VFHGTVGKFSKHQRNFYHKNVGDIMIALLWVLHRSDSFPYRIPGVNHHGVLLPIMKQIALVTKSLKSWLSHGKKPAYHPTS
jgi:hypothetical protein